MAYFNHAFSKMFLGTGDTRAVAPVTSRGFITGAGITTTELSELPTGYFGFFDAKTYESIDLTYTIDEAHRILRSGGVLVIEHTESQGSAIADVLAIDFLEIALHDDLVGRPRWTSAVRR
mgnify:CR=1 FL=1